MLAWVSVWTLFAQQPDETAKRVLEREVKTSGNYLYGEAIANTKDEAVKAAKTALVSEINKEVLDNHDWQFAKTIQAKDVEYNIYMIDLMRSNKFRVIAYIKKDNLAIIFHDDKTPEVELADKKATAPATVQPVEVVTLTQVEETPTPVVVAETPKPQPTSGGDLLEQIVTASSLQQIQSILVANKKNGKAAYGKIDKLIQSEVAYLIVYKQTGEIVAILNRGSDNQRKDLISGKTYGKEIFSNNQVIWFQLFK
jgi:hypothetical protein